MAAAAAGVAAFEPELAWNDSDLCPPYAAHEVNVFECEMGQDQLWWVAVFVEDDSMLQWLRLPTGLQALMTLHALANYDAPVSLLDVAPSESW